MRRSVHRNPAPADWFERYAPVRGFGDQSRSVSLTWVDVPSARIVRDGTWPRPYNVARGLLVQLWGVRESAHGEAHAHLRVIEADFVRDNDGAWRPAGSAATTEWNVWLDPFTLEPTARGLREVGMAPWLALQAHPVYRAMRVQLARLGAEDDLRAALRPVEPLPLGNPTRGPAQAAPPRVKLRVYRASLLPDTAYSVVSSSPGGTPPLIVRAIVRRFDDTREVKYVRVRAWRQDPQTAPRHPEIAFVGDRKTGAATFVWSYLEGGAGAPRREIPERYGALIDWLIAFDDALGDPPTHDDVELYYDVSGDPPPLWVFDEPARANPRRRRR